MPLMGVKRSSRRYASARLERLARSLLNASTLCAISTVAPNGRAYINAAYFAWSPSFDIIWYSARQAQHSRNLERNGAAAVVVFDSHQTWGNPDRGIMMFGSAQAQRGKAATEAEQLYARRFRRYDGDGSPDFPFYRFRPQRVKLFHERALGAGTFVTARNRAGRLLWETTDIYE